MILRIEGIEEYQKKATKASRCMNEASVDPNL